MFLIRLAFWLGLVVLLLPTDERQQAKLYGTAVSTVERVVTFCDRNAQLCSASVDFWATFLRKAEFGARVVGNLMTSSGRKDEVTPAVDVVPAPAPAPADLRRRLEPRPEPRAYPSVQGTLTPTDLSPAWRGGSVQRTGT
jgi:hypothetical protein